MKTHTPSEACNLAAELLQIITPMGRYFLLVRRSAISTMRLGPPMRHASSQRRQQLAVRSSSTWDLWLIYSWTTCTSWLSKNRRSTCKSSWIASRSPAAHVMSPDCRTMLEKIMGNSNLIIAAREFIALKNRTAHPDGYRDNALLVPPHILRLLQIDPLSEPWLAK